MPRLPDAENLPVQYSKKYLVIRDADIADFTESGVNTIVLPPYAVCEGLICARHPAIARNLKDAPTYQDLIAKNEDLIEKYRAEMDTLDKLQFKIRMIEELIGRYRERSEERESLIESREKTQFAVVEELNKQLDSARKNGDGLAALNFECEKEIRILKNRLQTKIDQLDELKSRNWWRRLFG